MWTNAKQRDALRPASAARPQGSWAQCDRIGAADALILRMAVIAVAIAAGAAVSGTSRAAEHIAIGAGDCETGVHLVARGAPLTDVLQRLSEALSFELRLAGPSDSVVDVDVSLPGPELLAKLSPLDNLIVTQGRDPQCRGQYRVVKVWMLPKAGPTAGAASSSSSAAMAAAVSRVATPHQLSEAEKREIESGEEAYRRMHGIPPPPPQDDASK